MAAWVREASRSGDAGPEVFDMDSTRLAAVGGPSLTERHEIRLLQEVWSLVKDSDSQVSRIYPYI